MLLMRRRPVQMCLRMLSIIQKLQVQETACGIDISGLEV